VDEDPEGHKFSLSLMSVNGELPGHGILIDIGFFYLHV